MRTSRRSIGSRLRIMATLVLAVPAASQAQEGTAGRLLKPMTTLQIVTGQRGGTRPLDGGVLVRYSGAYDVYEMLLREYGLRLQRVECVVVDERQIPHSRGWASYLRRLRPEGIERVDLLFSGAMLRIYTLDFIDHTPHGLVRLHAPSYVERQHVEPLCT